MDFDPVKDGWAALPADAVLGQVWRKLDADGAPRFALQLEARHADAGGQARSVLIGAFATFVFEQGLAHALAGRSAHFTLASSSSNHLGPAATGEWLEGKADLLRRGRSVAFLHGELSVGDRPILAGDCVFALQQQ